MIAVWLTASTLFVNVVAADAVTKPHLVFVLADDLGHSCVGYNAPKSVFPVEIKTPNIDTIASEGIKLTRHYSYKFCSPTRSSLQSGRLPVHVNTVNIQPESVNKFNKVSGYAGIPPNMTSIAKKLSAAGYKTYATGKWDAGMAHVLQTPVGRGYEKFLGYFHHANDYYTENLPLSSIGTVNVCDNKFTDLWNTTHAAYGLNGTAYEPELFASHSLAAIATHDVETPMFLFHSFHLVHTPLQVPEDYLNNFSYINNTERQKLSAMVSYMDGIFGRLIKALKAKNMWDSTFLVFAADNGGAIYYPAGGNNYPLRGGKMGDFEGGIRTVAFVSGGIVAPSLRGTSFSGMISIADWLGTFCEGANGIDCNADPEAEREGLPPIDSISHWKQFTGQPGGAARTVLHASSQALIVNDMKIIVGRMEMSGWTGPQYLNNTGTQPSYIPPGWVHDCGKGCLFNITSDPTEHVDLAETEPTILGQLQGHLKDLNKKLFMPDRGFGDKQACTQAEKNGGYYGPFIGL